MVILVSLLLGALLILIFHLPLLQINLFVNINRTFQQCRSQQHQYNDFLINSSYTVYLSTVYLPSAGQTKFNMNKQKESFLQQWEEKFPGVSPPDVDLTNSDTLTKELAKCKELKKNLESQLNHTKFLLIFLQVLSRINCSSLY